MGKDHVVLHVLRFAKYALLSTPLVHPVPIHTTNERRIITIELQKKKED